MGGNQSHLFDETLFNQQWERKEGFMEGRTVWRNKSQPSREIEEYPIYADTEDDIERERELFYLRKDSSQLVAATHLKETVKSGLCSSAAQGRLFLEKIPLKLQALQHIPFPDVLHLHFNALTGYRRLNGLIGPFRPQNEQIGFNNLGEAKVWLNSDFSASHPTSKQISEFAMVRNLLQLIEDVTDNTTTPRQNPSILNYVYRNRTEVTFDQALTSIKQYANEFNGGQIPKNLQCIQKIGVDTISRTLIGGRQQPLTSNHLESYRSGFNNNGAVTVQQPQIVNSSFAEQRNPTVLSSYNVYPARTSFVQPVQPVQFNRPIQASQPVAQIPVGQPINFVQPPQLGTSGIRGSRVNFVPPAQTEQPIIQCNQFQTVRPIQQAVFVKQPEAQRVIQQIVRSPQGTVDVFPSNQNSRQQVFQPVAEGLVFRQPQISKCPPMFPQGYVPAPVQIVNINPQAEVSDVKAAIAQVNPAPVVQSNQNSQVNVQNLPAVEQPKPQIPVQETFLQTETAFVKQGIDQAFVESQEFTTLYKQQTNFTEVNGSEFVPRSRNFIDSNTMNIGIEKATTQEFQSYNSSADKFALNFEPSSSRYKDVGLDDGKSSEALLAELKGFSSRKNISYSTNAFDYSSKFKSSNEQTPLYSNNYQTSLTNDNADIYATFNKYSKGESLEDNLEMKYSMTKNLYDQPQSGHYEYEESGREGNLAYEQNYEQNYERNYGNNYDQHYEQNHYEYNQEHESNLHQDGDYHVDYDPEILADIQKLKGG